MYYQYNMVKKLNAYIVKYNNAHISISCAVYSNLVIDSYVFSYR